MSQAAANPDGPEEGTGEPRTSPEATGGVDGEVAKAEAEVVGADGVGDGAEGVGAGAEGVGAGADDEVSDDALAALRTELEAVDDVPVGERVELFERANETLAAELAALDEV